MLWAYFSPSQVRFTGTDATEFYQWGEKSIKFHHCPRCFCLTHWAAVDATVDRLGLNVRLMGPEALQGARIRRLDGANTWKYLDEA